jgi:hypothetical protein
MRAGGNYHYSNYNYIQCLLCARSYMHFLFNLKYSLISGPILKCIYNRQCVAIWSSKKRLRQERDGILQMNV